MAKSNKDPAEEKREAYAALVKPGDAVETPDGNVWVVRQSWLSVIEIASARRDEHGVIKPDMFGQAVTAVPVDFVTKIADAREVIW